MEPNNSVGSSEHSHESVQSPAATASIEKPVPRTFAVSLLWVALIAVTAAMWWAIHAGQEAAMEAINQELTKRDANIDQRLAMATVDHQSVAALRERVNSLEAKLDLVGNKATSLEAQYQDMMLNRDERLLADLEQSVMTASQQLQLAGNVDGAIIVLQASDVRLAANPSSRFVALRRLIARDIERLKSSTIADSSGTTLKLESIVAAVDGFPLAFEQRVRRSSAAAAMNKTVPPLETASQAPSVAERLRQLVAELWHEMHQLVRIERVDLIEPALLMPPQIYFLRENLKLRLLAARVALLQRDGKVYHEELRQAQSSLTRFFDTRAASVRAADETLKLLLSRSGNVELPSLDATLSAIRVTRIPRASP